MTDANSDQDQQSGRGTRRRRSQRAFYAYGSGVRSTLRHNATAYGFSIMITCSYGLLTVAHPGHAFGVATMLFAGGALLAFVLVDVAASTAFRRMSASETPDVEMVSGVVDVLSVLIAVGIALGLAQTPHWVAWPVTSFGATAAYLLIGGVDVLIARRAAGRPQQ